MSCPTMYLPASTCSSDVLPAVGRHSRLAEERQAQEALALAPWHASSLGASSAARCPLPEHVPQFARRRRQLTGTVGARQQAA